MPNTGVDSREPKRDLEADMDLCNKATPGPWYAGATDDEHFMNLHYVTTEPRSYRHDGEMAFVEGLIRRDKVVAITLLQTPRFVDCWQFGENTRFIAEAREGWPYAIERAIKAEALIDDLIEVFQEMKYLPNAIRRDCTEPDKMICYAGRVSGFVTSALALVRRSGYRNVKNDQL